MDKSEIYYQFIAKLKQQKNIRLVASKAKVAPSTVYNWLQGNSVPTLDKAQQVLDVIDSELSIKDRR